MNEKEEKLIEERKTMVRDAFGDRDALTRYLFDTLGNFFYRYLEKELPVVELAPKTFGAVVETPMLAALKKPHPDAKQGIIEAAKSNKDATVRSGLWVEVSELTPDFGKLKIVAEINWGHPEFKDPGKRIQKIVNFSYDDLAVFRKELAQRLEEVSELFN